MPIAVDGEEHNCEDVMMETATSQTDLKATPLKNPEMTVFVDGSSTRAADGSLLSGYAVCSEIDVLESGKPPRYYSAQQAELCALIVACNLAEDKSTTICTDSQYAYRVAHDVGALWKVRGYITSSGIPVKNGKLTAKLLEAIH